MRKARRILAGVMCLMALAGAGVAKPNIEAYAAESSVETTISSVKIVSAEGGYGMTMVYTYATTTNGIEFQLTTNPYTDYYGILADYVAVKGEDKITIESDIADFVYISNSDYAGYKIYSSVNGIMSTNYIQIPENETGNNPGGSGEEDNDICNLPDTFLNSPFAESLIAENNLKINIVGIAEPGQTVSVGGYTNCEYMWFLEGKGQVYWNTLNKSFTIPVDAKGKKLYVKAYTRLSNTDVYIKSNIVTIGEPGNDTPGGSDGKLTDSSKDTQYETNDNFADEIYAGSNKSVEAHVTQGAQFTVIIPRKIVLDGKSGSGDYDVVVMGDIPGNQEINVEPKESTFTMSTVGKPSVTANITQNKTKFSVALDTMEGLKSGAVAGGTIEANGLTAGKWTGIFNFAISVSEKAA